MRSLVIVLCLVTAALASGCGQCDCVNIATLTLVDRTAGNSLAPQSITMNAALTPQYCGLDIRSNIVTSTCKTFGLDVVAVGGKRFSGVIDLNYGADSLCGPACKTQSITLPVE
jgi:hypothetical protein